MNHRLQTFFAALLALALIPTHAAVFKFKGQTFTVPDGFEVELVSTTNLAQRPVSASFDELGRLYVTDSSGSNAKLVDQIANPDSRVVRLEDTDGDGRFDKSVVFADKVVFPEGCLFYDGSVYISAVPSIWKLTDTNNDGVADARVEWHQGKTTTGCGNDLHGPFLGPDGWLYWCKGAFAEQTYEVNGKSFTTRAAHIFRKRPDGTGIEPVLTGGMDNPVGVTFTAEGERILCGTFFAPHEPGHRDGLIHAIYGGVYGKINAVNDGHVRTGDLMPVMTHMGPAAPAAVIRYESRGFGGEYQNNLFCAQFNTHKVSRHILAPDGATFKTTDSDFLVSDSADFHPTDVIEDADGSLLVIDTGAWYKLCCPTSQLAKPDVLGAIYRVRRVGAKKIPDPRGLKLVWEKMSAAELTELLDDERPAVVARAIHLLAKQGERALDALRTAGNFWNMTNAPRPAKPPGAKKRQNIVWTLTRIDSPKAREAVHVALSDNDETVRAVALQSVSVWRDPDNSIHLGGFMRGNHPASSRRIAAEAIGRVAATNLVSLLLSHGINEMRGEDRVLEHSLIYALVQLNDPSATKAWTHAASGTPPKIVRAALIALDQMDNGGLKAEMVAPLLASPDAALRKTAMWIAGHHPDWGGALAGFFRERLAVKNLPGAELAELGKQLAQFGANPDIQSLMAETLGAPSTPGNVRETLLGAMAEADLKQAPKSWPEAINLALEAQDDSLARAAIAAARTLGRAKSSPPDFSERLQRIAGNPARADDLRLAALAALPKGLKSVGPTMLDFLRANLASTIPVATRSAAASVLARAKLTNAQLLQLADTLKATGPLEVSQLLPAFEQTTDEAVGIKLIAALKESKGLSGARPDALKTLAAKYPASVQAATSELIATLNADAAKQGAHVDELLANLPKGEIRNGQAIFNSSRAACSACHKMGYGGGTVGPDLTRIGEVRTERDLLEAIVYPSASFVRSYEPFIVHTKSDEDYSGVLAKDGADEIVLATGPNAEARVARSDITDMRPGTVSVMPGGLDQQLTKQELADLVAFLKNTKWGAN